MKSKGIPEHKMNFTGDVGQALENTVGAQPIASKKIGVKSNNTKKEQ